MNVCVIAEEGRDVEASGGGGGKVVVEEEELIHIH
jgi:hypothetical protein